MTAVQKGISSYQNNLISPRKYYSTFLPVGRQNIDWHETEEKSNTKEKKDSFKDILKEKIKNSESH